MKSNKGLSLIVSIVIGLILAILATIIILALNSTISGDNMQTLKQDVIFEVTSNISRNKGYLSLTEIKNTLILKGYTVTQELEGLRVTKNKVSFTISVTGVVKVAE